VSLQICTVDSIAPATPQRIQHFRELVVAGSMRRLVLLACFFALAGCSTSGYDDEPPMRQRPAMAEAEGPVQTVAGLALPQGEWWHQAEIADLVKPSGDQVAALDKLQTEQGDELMKLERDMSIVERDLRNALDADQPTVDAIVAAGQRIRTMRDDLFDRQVRFLAAERTILTRAQWSALEDAIRNRPRGREGNGGRGRGTPGGYPGRGGRRGGGGFPGW
jgi:hypothetical protein